MLGHRFRATLACKQLLRRASASHTFDLTRAVLAQLQVMGIDAEPSMYKECLVVAAEVRFGFRVKSLVVATELRLGLRVMS